MKMDKRLRPLDLAIEASPNPVVEPAVEPEVVNLEPTPAPRRAEPAPKTSTVRPPRNRPPPRDPRPAAGAERRELGASRAIWFTALAAAALWAGAILGMVRNAHPAGPWRDIELAQAAALVLIPAAFMALFGFSLVQALHLVREARRIRAMSDDLITPAALAAAHTGGVVEAVRCEIDRATLAATNAVHQLDGLRSVLVGEGKQIAEVGREAERGAQVLGDRLRSERMEMARLAAELGAQAADLADTLAERSRLIERASEAAQTQVRAAADGLEGQIDRLALAADAAERAADEAAGKLANQAGRLAEAGSAIDQTLAQLGGGLTQEREQLGALIEALRIEQEDADVLSESRTARLTGEMASARASAEAVTEAAADGAEALRALGAEAAERLRALSELGRSERHRLAAEAEASLERIADGAADRRTTLVQSAQGALDSLSSIANAAAVAAEGRLAALREEADTLADATRARVDELGEAAFEAGRRADQAFESRIATAQRSVEAVAAAMEESSRRSAVRIEAGLTTTRDALRGFEALLRDVDARFARLPEEARGRAEEVRTAIEAGVEALSAAARRTAEETLAVDAAFQDRVRRNYANLSEAVRLMTAMTDAAEPERRAAEAARAGPPAPPPAAAEAAYPAAAASRTAPEPASAPPAVELDLRRAAEARRRIPDLAPERTVGATSAGAGGALRPRLRLTPTHEDEAAHALFEPATALDSSSLFDRAGSGTKSAGPAEANWTWKDLLSNVEDPPSRDVGDSVARLAAEIAGLGLDANALLPNARTVEASRAHAGGGLDGVRESVRRAAPAAVRRLSRRVLTDRVLRAEATQFVRAQREAVSAAARTGAPALEALFASEVGRTYLLLDAAVGDLD